MASSETKKTGRYKTSSALTRPAERKRRAPVREMIQVPLTPEPVEVISVPQVSPIELYRLEKARRAKQREEIDPLAKAKAEFKALLESEANASKGGRPRKSKVVAVAQADGDTDVDV